MNRLKNALEWVRRQTNLRTKQARMLSDGIQGEFLQAFSLMVRPGSILEIGTFTGYSSICLSRGMKSGGHLDACEIDDELTDIIRGGWERAGISATLFTGDAQEIIPSLSGPYDIVYIDADKRQYSKYYSLVFDKVSPGGWILVDNTAWSGRVISGFSQNATLETAHSRRDRHDPQTEALIAFDSMIRSDSAIEYITLPIRDGLTIIRKTE
ncbi:MAG: class I SAM-dependent methyltransferase [Alistipes sp.]|nr:class I SAM-dependent methyltransferase [Candidatus Minthomonas equi]